RPGMAQADDQADVHAAAATGSSRDAGRPGRQIATEEAARRDHCNEAATAGSAAGGGGFVAVIAPRRFFGGDLAAWATGISAASCCSSRVNIGLVIGLSHAGP